MLKCPNPIFLSLAPQCEVVQWVIPFLYYAAREQEGAIPFAGPWHVKTFQARMFFFGCACDVQVITPGTILVIFSYLDPIEINGS